MMLYITNPLCVELGLRKLLGWGFGYGQGEGLVLFANGKPEYLFIDMADRTFRVEYRTFAKNQVFGKWMFISENLDIQIFRALASAVSE